MFVNLTPHTICLPDREVPPSGVIVRCQEHDEEAYEVEGVPVVYRRYGAVEDLPPPVPGTHYLVSALVRLAYPERTDFLSPGDLIRDADGQVVGCGCLVANPATNGGCA